MFSMIWTGFSGERCGPWASCLFFCLMIFFVPLENFSIIWGRHHCYWRATKWRPIIDIHMKCKMHVILVYMYIHVHIAIELWRLPHRLWHVTPIFKVISSTPLCKVFGGEGRYTHGHSSTSRYWLSSFRKKASATEILDCKM